MILGDKSGAHSHRARAALPACALTLALAGCTVMSDHGVAVSSTAFKDYTAGKYTDATPRRETYVFMEGNYFPGAIIDHSLQRLRFRQVAETLAPELARRAYFPAAEVKSADLVLVVHWGVTSPFEKMDKLLAQDPPSLAGLAGIDANTGVNYQPHTFNADVEQSLVSDQAVNDTFVGVTSADMVGVGFQDAVQRTDQLGAEYSRANAMRLLGYGRHLRLSQDHPFASAEEMTLRSDLDSERYFVVVQAYDLKQIRNQKPRLVWTLHLNMRAAGNNFREAVAMMSSVAVNYFGRTTDKVDTALPKVRQGTVTIGEITIVGESR